MRRITLHNHPGGVYLTLVNKWVHFLNKFLAWLSGLSTSQKIEQKFASQCNFFQMASFSWLRKNHYERVCHLKSWPELTKFCSIFLVKTNLTNPFFFIFFFLIMAIESHKHYIGIIYIPRRCTIPTGKERILSEKSASSEFELALRESGTSWTCR